MLSDLNLLPFFNYIPLLPFYKSKFPWKSFLTQETPPHNGSASFQEQSPISLVICKQIWKVELKIKIVLLWKCWCQNESPRNTQVVSQCEYTYICFIFVCICVCVMVDSCVPLCVACKYISVLIGGTPWIWLGNFHVLYSSLLWPRYAQVSKCRLLPVWNCLQISALEVIYTISLFSQLHVK